MGKRLLDILVAVFFITFFFWVFLMVAIAVRIKLGSPILFVQVRPGFKGKPFAMYKFRTMQIAYDEESNALNDDMRMTSFGRFLRSSSLDELPELYNVLRGDMSLVGPRPLLAEYLKLYSKKQRRRHDVKPGITGWAQINGRNSISWEEKFDLDVWYVDHHSFWLDLKILTKSVAKVASREGITSAGYCTASKFEGN